jgi:hypothetical protein
VPPTAHTELIKGWILRLQKNREGIDFPFGCLFSIIIRHKSSKIKLHLDYKCGFSFTKPAFRFQKLRFVYKYSVVVYKHLISFYKVAFPLLLSNKNPKYRKIKENMLTNGK